MFGEMLVILEFKQSKPFHPCMDYLLLVSQSNEKEVNFAVKNSQRLLFYQVKTKKLTLGLAMADQNHEILQVT